MGEDVKHSVVVAGRLGNIFFGREAVTNQGDRQSVQSGFEENVDVVGPGFN